MIAPRHGAVSQLIGGSVLIFGADALLVPSGLLTAAFLTRWLGPGDYGLFALATTLVAWGEWGVTSIFARATIRFVADADDWRPVGVTVLQLYLLAACAAAALLCLLAEPIATLLHEPSLAGYLRLYALDIPLFSLAQAHRNILIGLGRFGPRAAAAAGRWITRLALIVGLVGIGFSVSGAIFGSIGASLAELAIGRCYVQPALFRRAHLPIREFGGYVVPLFLFAASMRLFDK